MEQSELLLEKHAGIEPADQELLPGEAERLFADVSENSDTETFRHYLYLAGRACPDKAAVEWRDPKGNGMVSVTYRELMLSIAALGTALYSAGLQDKKAALIGKTEYSWVLAFLTMVCSSITVIPLDPNAETEELRRRLRFCDAELCFAGEDTDFFLEREGAGIQVIGLDSLEELVQNGKKLLKEGSRIWTDSRLSQKEEAIMLFTSGTGGIMKAAVLRQENFTLERLVWEGLEAGKSSCLITLPLYHVAGLGDLRGSLMTGTTAVLSSGLKYLLEEYAYAKPRVGFMVPAQAMLLYGIISGKDPETGRKLLGGNFAAIRATGAPLPENVRECFASYGVKVTSDYGMTETAGPVSVSVMKDGEIFSKPGSVGHILDCLDVTVENPDENGAGEIVISGQCVFSGYYKDPERTEEVLRDGKLYTGDIGFIDEDRFLFIIGRKKNIIILSNGENVIPEELEKLIYTIPEVRECLVYGKGDRIGAKIRSDSERKDLKEYLEAEVRKINAALPRYKQIGIIEIADKPLEKTPSGKIKRK